VGVTERVLGEKDVAMAGDVRSDEALLAAARTDAKAFAAFHVRHERLTLRFFGDGSATRRRSPT